MWGCFKNLLLHNVHKYIPLANNCNTWKKSSWRRPMDDRLRKARLWTRFVETRNPQYLKDYKKLRNEVRGETRILAKKNNVK